MLHTPTSQSQDRFYQENIDKILKEYSGGYLLFDGLSRRSEYFRTKERLLDVHPEIFGKRFGQKPLLIDIVKEQFERKEQKITPKKRESSLVNSV